MNTNFYRTDKNQSPNLDVNIANAIQQAAINNGVSVAVAREIFYHMCNWQRHSFVNAEYLMYKWPGLGTFRKKMAGKAYGSFDQEAVIAKAMKTNKWNSPANRKRNEAALEALREQVDPEVNRLVDEIVKWHPCNYAIVRVGLKFTLGCGNYSIDKKGGDNEGSWNPLKLRMLSIERLKSVLEFLNKYGIHEGSDYEKIESAIRSCPKRPKGRPRSTGVIKGTGIIGEGNTDDNREV